MCMCVCVCFSWYKQVTLISVALLGDDYSKLTKDIIFGHIWFWWSKWVIFKQSYFFSPCFNSCVSVSCVVYLRDDQNDVKTFEFSGSAKRNCEPGEKLLLPPPCLIISTLALSASLFLHNFFLLLDTALPKIFVMSGFLIVALNSWW